MKVRQMQDKSVNADKLSQVVEFLAQVRLILDGGWHYSSPLIRQIPDAPAPLVERPDALSIVADIVKDLDSVSSTLGELATRAIELDVDTVALCRADLGLLARVYQGLAQDVSAAANRAIDQLTISAKPERKARTPRQPKASSTNNPAQTSLPTSDTEPAELSDNELTDLVQGQ